MTAAVPSVLPEEGIDLALEIERYRTWMIEQALFQSGGNVAAASRLLGYHPHSLHMLLHRRRTGKSFRRGSAARVHHLQVVDELAPVELAPVELVPEPSSEPEPEPLTGLAARIPWSEVAQMRADGLLDWRIAQKLSGRLDAHRFAIEKALARPRPLAKCKP